MQVLLVDIKEETEQCSGGIRKRRKRRNLKKKEKRAKPV
jgi:hypothetical protein